MSDDPIIRAMEDAVGEAVVQGTGNLMQTALRAALEAAGYVHNPSRSYQASMPPKLIRTAYGDRT